MTHRLHRRRFLQTTTPTGLSYWLAAPGFSDDRIINSNEKVQVASIGVGGKGDSDCNHAGDIGEMVAICDIDEHRLNAKSEKFTQAKKYFDFRKMFDEMAKQIDA